MRFELAQSLEDYFRAGSETSEVLLKSGTDFRNAVDAVYSYFTNSLFAGELELKGISAFLAVNSFMLWLASVRIAVTGHAVATYPLFRVALESACYSLVTQRDAEKEAIWRDRDNDANAAKRCRDAMMGAVKEAAKLMNADQSGSGDIVIDGYQNSIDFGAHPNAKSIFLHLRSEENVDDAYSRLSLISLGSSASIEVRRTLIAALEYAFVIGTVLLRAIPRATQDQAHALANLHAEKERLVAAWFETEQSSATVHPRY